MEEVKKETFWERNFRGDRELWIIIAILAVISLLVIYSSTASMAYRKFGGDTSHYFVRQLFYIGLGFVGMYVTYRMNYQFYYKVARLVFFVSLCAIGLTFIIGTTYNDAARWIRIPIIGITIQPSDFLRIALVMVLARELAKRQQIINKIAIIPSLNPASWAGKGRQTNRDILRNTTIPLLLPIVLACGAIFTSNFSTAAITFLTCWIMLYIGRVKVSELMRMVFIALAAVSLLLVLMSAAKVGRAQTWTNRIMNFVGMTTTIAAPERKGGDDNLQVEQAKIAIATGRIGKGPGNSTQRVNLPHSYSDFAYAFIVEEYGPLGAAVVLLLYLWIFFRTIAIFQRCGTAFPSLLVLGLGLMIVLQAIINMLVSVNLIPVTGQTLPLISLGGSSLVFTSMALGMILGVSRQMEEHSLDTPKAESLLEKN